MGRGAERWRRRPPRADRRPSSRLRSPGAGCFAGGVEKAQHRVEPEPALVARRRALLVLGVDLHQGGVDVEHHLLGCATGCPRHFPGLRPRRAQRVEHGVIDLVHRPPDGGVGGHVTEQLGLVAQRGHVGHAAPARRQHHRHLGEQPASVLARRPLAGPRNRGRIATRQPRAVGDLAEEVRSHHRGGVSISDGHLNTLDGAASVHLAGALLVRLLDASATSESLTTRASPRMGPGQLTGPGERSGLATSP